MSNGTVLAASVNKALRSASAAVGDGPLVGIITRRGEPSGPSYAPTYGAPTDHAFNCIIGEFTAREREASSIPLTDIKIAAGTSDIEPNNSDTIAIAGHTYEIAQVWPKMAGGVIYQWMMWARR